MRFALVWADAADAVSSQTYGNQAQHEPRRRSWPHPAAGLTAPELPFLCTVRLSRRRWGLSPNDLPSVCRRLGIGLIHHDPGSDAEACARIVLAATAGPSPPPT